MLSRIDRYLIKEVLLTVSATLLVLLGMVLTHRLATYLNQAATGLLAQNAIFELLALQGIRYLVVLVPLAALLGIMLTLGRLYRDSEMTALTACGLGPAAVFRPLLLLAVPMAVALAGLSMFVVPRSMELLSELQSRARQDAEVSVFNPGTFREVMGGEHVIYVGGLAKGGRELRKIFIQSREPDGVAITTAERGHQEIDAQSGARFLVLNDGYRYEGTPGRGDYRNVKFQRLAVRVDTVPMEEAKLRREAIPTRDLLGSDKLTDRSEFQERLSGPLSLLLIAFVAPLLARSNPREGRYGRVVAAILIYTIYINLLEMGKAWLDRGTIWPWLGLWWVHGIFGMVGLALGLYQYGGGTRALRRRPGARVPP